MTVLDAINYKDDVVDDDEDDVIDDEILDENEESSISHLNDTPLVNLHEMGGSFVHNRD